MEIKSFHQSDCICHKCKKEGYVVFTIWHNDYSLSVEAQCKWCEDKVSIAMIDLDSLACKYYDKIADKYVSN